MNATHRNVVLFSLSKEKYLCLGINLNERGRKKSVVFKREVTTLKPKGEVLLQNTIMKCDRFVGFKRKLEISEDPLKNELQ